MMQYLKKVIRKALALVNRCFRFLLYLFFRFDKWHLNTLYEKKYAQDIIRYLNSRPNANKNAIEIGCGLGDIVRNLKYVHKTGYDMDVNVLKAARFLSRITFTKADFKWLKFPSTLNEKVDVIILVNWIHHIDSPILKSNLEKYFTLNLNAGGCIILDTVQDKEYRFNHNINYLAKDLDATLTKLGDYDRLREVWAINK